ncbi:hypothetical protein ACFL09_00450 [Planctomycetota bacterium]
MDSRGWLILLIPAIGLLPILRDKRWNWRVVRSHKLLNALFWLGWAAALVVGLLVLFGV